jgi:hypothetical protein
MRIYLAYALHMITEMTDEQMIAFIVHRVRALVVFLAAFPSLLRKYVKVCRLQFILYLGFALFSVLLYYLPTKFVIYSCLHASIVGSAPYLG